MGVITLALVSNGNLSGPHPGVPVWVVVSAASAIALGTYVGGWRIIRTVGHRITGLEPPQGFAAEMSSAATIVAASHAGFPLSTTHVTSGGVMGAGVGRRAADVHWDVVARMAAAWLLTLPAAGAMAALFHLATRALGTDVAGPLMVSALAAGGLYVVFTTK
jgi:PiT family inorganic phosphate transporter